MIDLLDLAAQLQFFAEAEGWKFCFIGGVAVQHWGEPRLTRDVDLTVLSGWGGEDTCIDALLHCWRLAQLPASGMSADGRAAPILPSSRASREGQPLTRRTLFRTLRA